MSENYFDNPLFISYGLRYECNDILYDDPEILEREYLNVIEFWEKLYRQFPPEYVVSDVINDINASGFHIGEIRDSRHNFRGMLFPNEKERLAFSLKYGL